MIDDLKKDINKQISQIIHFIDPPTEVDFVEVMKRAFEPICLYILANIEKGKSPSNFIPDNKFVNRIMSECFDVLTKNKNYSSIHCEYMIAIFKVVFVDCMQGDDIENELKHAVATIIKRGTADVKFIYGAAG